MPLPRSRSPVKTSLNSPAQRNPLLARNTISPQESSSQPTNSKRRLDFKNLGSNGPRSSSQSIIGKGIPKLSAVNGSARSLSSGYHSQTRYRQEESEEEEQEQADDQNNFGAEEYDEVNNFVEESIMMLAAETQPSPEPEEDSEPAGEEQTARAAASKRKPSPKLHQRGNGGRLPKAKPAPVAKASKATAQNRRVIEIEEEESDDEEQVEPPQVEGEATQSEEEIVAPKVRGRPPGKRKAPTPEPEPRPKKRRSLDEDEEEAGTSSGRKNKRPRAEAGPSAPVPKSRGRPPKKAAEQPAQPKASATKKAGKAEKPKKERRRKSSLAPGDTSLVVVERGPPLPKARGLMINRREVPGDSNSIKQTRSGRSSIRPLAYWRNERVDYEPEAASDAFAQKSKPSQLILPKIKEVVRYDEPEFEHPSKSRKGKRGAKGKARGRPRKSYDSDDDEGPPPEPWENNPGTVDGNVICWKSEHEFNPPAQDEYVDVEDRQIAISSAAVQTQTVKDASFRYAKILSEGFFNAGVVDLPPGSEKRPKNSRKMFMTFFVHTGRVLVTVNETSFRISKGGMWFVPRGNYYSIENDYDQPARIFFSQGCEVAPRPDEEEDEGEEKAEE